MNKKVILLVATDESKTYERLVSSNEDPAWEIIKTAGIESAIERSFQQDVDIAVVSKDFSQEAKKLRKILSLQNQGMEIIFNNDEELLVNKIREAVEKQNRNNRPSFSFVDDALKNSMLPVMVQ